MVLAGGFPAASFGRLAAELRTIALGLSADEPDDAGHARLAELAAAAVPGAEHAAVCRARGTSAPHTISATSDLAIKADALQFDTHEGPAWDAMRDGGVVGSPDLGKEARWAHVGPRAVAVTGLHSVVSFGLLRDSEHRAALSLYAGPGHAFGEASMAVGALVASYVSLAVIADVHREKAANLYRALETNRDIGVAIGILMARQLCTADQAFDQLRSASQHRHRKLREIATEVRETGQLA